eukprot:8526-Heterococcus_DN1.PRE.2
MHNAVSRGAFSYRTNPIPNAPLEAELRTSANTHFTVERDKRCAVCLRVLGTPGQTSTVVCKHTLLQLPSATT